MNRSRRLLILIILVAGVLLLPACQAGSSAQPQAEETPPAGIPVEIRGKTVYVDRVVSGLLCDDTWQGTIYVHEVEVKAWQDKPLFLRDCSLSIEPGTIVYVAAHNDMQFSKGCSCHQ